jgi:hypothetical protein
MAFSIAFVPDDLDVGLPPSASELPELGGIDATTTTLAGETTTTLAGDTTTTTLESTTTTAG